MSNELKLSIENFQSISYGELVFHRGTTVIIGQSNSGKTAVFRALKACLSNPIGSKRFIKNGSKSSSVSLEYQGNQIIWKRTPQESSYIINGEPFIKTGRSNAFKILEDTGFTCDDNDTIMNIEEELQLPFPFGISKTELFKLYENVFCVSDSAIILKSAKEQEEKVKNDISFLEADLLKNKNKLEELKDFKKSFDLKKLEEMKSNLKGKQQEIASLKEGLPIIEKAVKADKFKTNNLEKFKVKDLIEEYKEHVQIAKEVYKLKEIHKLKQSLPAELTLIDKLPKIKEMQIIERTVKTLKKLENIKIREEKFENKLANYKDLKEVLKVAENLSKLDKVKVKEERFENNFYRYQELSRYLKDLKEIYRKLKLKKEKLEEAKGLLEELEAKLKEFDVCPLCKRPFKDKL